MNIYRIKRIGRTDYDEYAGFVVVAETTSKARTIVSNGFGRSVFGRSDMSTCELVGTAGPKVVPGILLSDYRAG